MCRTGSALLRFFLVLIVVLFISRLAVKSVEATLFIMRDNRPETNCEIFESTVFIPQDMNKWPHMNVGTLSSRVRRVGPLNKKPVKIFNVLEFCYRYL